MSVQIPPELLDRMVALVKSVAEPMGAGNSAIATEARAIAALLPDPDLEAARRISSSEYSKIYGRPGSYPDGSIVTQAALAGIKHGRGDNSKTDWDRNGRS